MQVGGLGAVIGTTVVTLFHSSILSLAKIFLDPLNNDAYSGDIGINVATLLQETNDGSVRWRKAAQWVPEGAKPLAHRRRRRDISGGDGNDGFTDSSVSSSGAGMVEVMSAEEVAKQAWLARQGTASWGAPRSATATEEKGEGGSGGLGDLSGVVQPAAPATAAQMPPAPTLEAALETALESVGAPGASAAPARPEVVRDEEDRGGLSDASAG